MKRELFEDLVASVKEGGSILRGEKSPSRRFDVTPVDVKRIRQGYDLTQAEFAAMIGVSLRTLQNWEQGRRHPDGPARVLLQIAARHPEAVIDTIRASQTH